MYANFENVYASDALAFMDRDRLGLPQLARHKLGLPPAPLLRLLSRAASHPDCRNLFFRGDEAQTIEDRLLETYEYNKYHVILNHLIKANMNNGPDVKISFWALAKGEAIFSSIYSPFLSHEERATGFLVASYVAELAAASRQKREFQLDRESRPGFQLSIFDTATRGNETHTGADIGFVIRSGQARNTLVKSARIQVKIAKRRSDKLMFRFSNNVPSRLREKMEAAHLKGRSKENLSEDEINLLDQACERLKFHQLDSLGKSAGLGYYAVLDVPDEADDDAPIIPPIVISANLVAKIERGGGSADALAAELEGIPMSAFLSLGLTSRDSGLGWVAPERARIADDRRVLNAIDHLFQGASPPQYGLFVDVSEEPLGRRFAKRIAARLNVATSEPPESAWPHFDSVGEPKLPDNVPRDASPP